MKKLPYIFLLSNVFLLSSERDIKYTKGTRNRARSEGSYSRWDARDSNECAGYIEYSPDRCYIDFLYVCATYRKQGIGAELASRSIEDMRRNHNCREIALMSAPSAKKFWERLGAKPIDEEEYVFPDGSKLRD